MSLTVREVALDGDPTRLHALLDLPERLHGDDPAWVAPIHELERHRLRASNPFFKEATLKLFVAERDGEVVGSVSVLADRNFQAHHGEAVVWFGYLAAQDDDAIFDALLSRARDEAKALGGAVLRGPRNLTRWEYVGLTVEGFDRPPPMLQGHHPPYYMRQLERFGLQKHHDSLAYEVDLYQPDGSPAPLPPALQAKVDACQLPGLTVRRARWRSMGRDLSDAHTVLNASYASVPDANPMPRATFLAIGRLYLAFANAELLQIAHVDGKPVAFAVCLPEVNEALVAAHGHALPLGWLKALRARRQVRTAAFKLIGVLPELRGTGVHARLIAHVVEGARRAGYTRIDGSVIDERNGPMRAVVEGAGMTIWRRYRVYELPLA